MTALALPVRQGTDAWLDARRQGIGASDIPVIAGESPYRSALELWAEKSGVTNPEPDADQADLFAWGHMSEPALLAFYERKTGRRTKRAPQMRVHPEVGWALASLDATAPIRRVIECKSSTSSRWGSEGIPDDVLFQVQWQLFVTGWEVADVVVTSRPVPRIVEVPRDGGLIENLFRLAEDFWHHVQNGVPPMPDGSESARRTIARLHPVDDGTYLPATPDLVELVDLYRSAKLTAKSAEDAEKGIGNALRAVLADASGIEGLLTYRKSADSTRTNWPAVASAYRQLVTGHPDAVLDTIVDLHSETSQGPRQLRLTKAGS